VEQEIRTTCFYRESACLLGNTKQIRKLAEIARKKELEEQDHQEAKAMRKKVVESNEKMVEILGRMADAGTRHAGTETKIIVLEDEVKSLKDTVEKKMDSMYSMLQQLLEQNKK